MIMDYEDEFLAHFRKHHDFTLRPTDKRTAQIRKINKTIDAILRGIVSCDQSLLSH